MFKIIFDAITDSVEAYKSLGIVVMILVLLMYLAKTYFHISPPPEKKILAPKPEINRVIFKNIHKWLVSKKDVSPFDPAICLVTCTKDKKCLIVFHTNELPISIFYRISSFAINQQYDFFITITSNSSDLIKEANSIYYKAYYKDKLRDIGKRNRICYNLNSLNYEKEVSGIFKVFQITSLVEYNFWYFLKMHQIL